MNRRVIFLNSVFPCLSETFVYDQLVFLRQAGMSLAIVSNHRPSEEQVHPRMRGIQDEVIYLRDAGIAEVLGAHVFVFLRHPLRYIKALMKLVSASEPPLSRLAHFSGAAILIRRFDHGTPRPRLHVNFTYGAAGVAMWAARLAGIRYSITLHGSDLIYDFPPDLEAKLRHADVIVSISHFNIAYLREHFPTVKPDAEAVIPLGVPALAGSSVPSPRPGPLRILNVGRLSEHKAQHHLIDACALLAKRGVDFVCDIVGEGPARHFLETRIREHGLESRVRLLGPKFHHEVLDLYNHTDLFVLCSITEGMPVVLMEAMRAGVPVISSAISGIPELVRDGGVLVPPADAGALADAIMSIESGAVDGPTLAKRAKAIIERDFQLETNHLRFKDFLDSLPS